MISIAAIEGAAIGAGFELALGCNLIVAAEDARFALPQVRRGVIPAVATAVLPRIAPRRRAMEWVLTAAEIDPHRLERDGVINRLYPPAEFDARLAGFVAALARASGPVLKLARRAQFEAYYNSFPDALSSIQSLYMNELMPLNDAREGPRAVRDGREPVWTHS
jgi:enoyl-CoA hydratase